MRKRVIQRERGTAIPMLALMLVALLVMSSLALDLGVLYTARTSAQHAADAAALAGAYTFLQSTAVQPGAATNAAVSVAAQNSILGQPVTITSANVSVDVANRRVTVTVPRTGANGIPTFFARVTGRTLVDVVTTATAEASATASGSRCVKPIYLPNTALSSNTVDVACSRGEVLFDSSGNLTAYAQARLGSSMSVRPADPAFALEPGQFYSLDFGSGASTYECAIAQCLNYCGVDPELVACGNSYPLKTGDMVGPTRMGVGDLVGSPPDTFVAAGQYQDASGQVWDSSRSLMTTPVWNDCVQKISPGYAGQKVTVIGFANVFIDGMRGRTVYGHLVDAIGCGGAGGSGGSTGGTGGAGAGTGPLATPVRLVNP